MKVKKLKTREAILDACIECFATRGVENTKIIDVAKIAKINHSLLLYHFPTFEGLCKAVIEVILEGLKTPTIQALEAIQVRPQEALKKYVYAPFLWAKANPHHFNIWLYFYYKANFPGEFKTLNSQIRQHGRTRIRHLILDLIHFGHCPPMDPKVLESNCLIIQGIITGNTIMSLTEEKLEIEAMAELTYNEVKRILQIGK